MRQAAIPLLLFFKEAFPSIFSNVAYDEKFPKEYMAKITLTGSLFEPL